jgi:adenylate cyclase
VGLDELHTAVAEDRLALLPLDRLMDAGAKYTPLEVAESVGLDIEALERATRAFGLPVPPRDGRTEHDEDVEAARLLKAVLDAGISEEAVTEFNRVVGRATAQVAAAARTMVLEESLRAGSGDERTFGHYWLQAAEQLTPLVQPVLGYTFREHLREIIRSDAVASADIVAGQTPGARDIVVAFADLVGFTRLGESIPAEELGLVARHLEELAADLVGPPVRLVKTVGDAVMLVSPDAPALVEATLTLVAAAEEDAEEFLQLRAGVAAGPALERSGDWFGAPVNLASRVTSIARPASVLATSPVKEATEELFAFSFAGARRIRGLSDEVPLYRVRPREHAQG